MKHFKLLLDQSIQISGHTLYRIQATRNSRWAQMGDVGGFVESVDNLSDEAWVYGNAWVFGDAKQLSNVIKKVWSYK